MGLPGVAMGCHELPGVAMGCHELPGVACGYLKYNNFVIVKYLYICFVILL